MFLTVRHLPKITGFGDMWSWLVDILRISVVDASSTVSLSDVDKLDNRWESICISANITKMISKVILVLTYSKVTKYIRKTDTLVFM